MINPERAALFIPSGLKDFKLRLFERIAAKLGRVVRGDFSELEALSADFFPIVGCTPGLMPIINRWRQTGRRWGYWDRGYARRVFASDLPWGEDGGYYRWHVGSFQMPVIRDVPDDRWLELKLPSWPWNMGGRHVVVAEPTPTYMRFHEIEDWTKQTLARLKELTDRPIVVRDKEMQRFGRRLSQDLSGAHALVAHGSNAATEAVIMGCPVFVDRSSAAALVGQTDLSKIEAPVYPDRSAWMRSLAYCQFNERELVDGTLWRLME